MRPFIRSLRRYLRAYSTPILFTFLATLPQDAPNADPLTPFKSAPLPPNLQLLHSPPTVILYTTNPSAWHRTPPSSSPPFLRALDSGRIEVRSLPPETALPSTEPFSNFLTKPWLWAQLQSAPRVLVFQTDSVLCSASPTRAEDFFGYDFIGAPSLSGKGFSGGLSLRNPRLMLEIALAGRLANDSAQTEEEWFVEQLRMRGGGAKLPTEEEAKKFAVGEVWYETPLGYHRPQRWEGEGERMGLVEEWCPEVGMVGARGRAGLGIGVS
ncbi:hypothetical protein CONLIGDRAFT_716289 [Coniochaeta ligniaria NRRL 30616]|uniref:DUF5672 domain-containing protein n=1 Tax=Coniochaeta ligniaria NRRL 30616 TaxID=1408157 RepID=A0A1J7JF62_9PEZI|nr:hypothetical protein CONLIGDRAFT_716289 [Coniochaeta ligniaria NRRL 30616]